MEENINKAISTPKGILIVAVFTLIVFGGVVGYKCWQQSKGDFVEGTVKIPEEPLEEETEEETANWQTYRNEDWGYETKYPADWQYRDYRDDPNVGELISFVAFGEGELPSERGYLRFKDIVIMVERGDYEGAYEGKLSLFKHEPLTSEIFETEIDVGGVRGIKQYATRVGEGGVFRETRVLVSYDDLIYRFSGLSLSIEEENLFLNQILSTVHFFPRKIKELRGEG